LGNPASERFETGLRQFTPFSLATGAVWQLTGAWQLTGNLARTQRAPKDYELFANGPHLATHAWEVGNSALGLEKSTSFDTGLQWRSGAQRMAITAFVNRFQNFIGLMGTTQTQSDLPVQTYQGVRARLQGLEANGRFRLFKDVATLDLDWRADAVRATNDNTGEPLPRIAPLRLGATLVYAQGPWNAKLGVDAYAAQHRVPLGSVATAAYTLVNASAAYRQQVGGVSLQWFARLDNITDQLAYSASSILTSTAFGKAPLPGRALKLGVQMSF
jgi:iron complex outermembrane receptor protein